MIVYPQPRPQPERPPRPGQTELRSSFSDMGRILEGTPEYPTKPAAWNNVQRNRRLISSVGSATIEAWFAEMAAAPPPHDYTERRLRIRLIGDNASGPLENMDFREMPDGQVEVPYYSFDPAWDPRGNNILNLIMDLNDMAELQDPDPESYDTPPEYVDFSCFGIDYRPPDSVPRYDPEGWGQVFSKDRAVYLAALLSNLAEIPYRG